MKRDPLLDRYLSEIGETPLLTRSEEKTLARKVRKGDSKARDQMIRANLRLVVKIAGQYRNCGMSLCDVIAEGNTGLIKAVERFDPEVGAKFSTYAAFWIKQAIRRGLSNQSRTVRLPVHMVEKINKFRSMRNRLEEKRGGRVSQRELLKATGLDRKLLLLVQESGQAPSSLDAPLSPGDSSSASLHEHMADTRNCDPAELLSQSDLAGQIVELCRSLDDRERRIIEVRFGLGGRRPQTLGDLGLEFGVTRERVRQIQNIAIGKLRAELRRRETVLPAAMRRDASSDNVRSEHDRRKNGREVQTKDL